MTDMAGDLAAKAIEDNMTADNIAKASEYATYENA